MARHADNQPQTHERRSAQAGTSLALVSSTIAYQSLLAAALFLLAAVVEAQPPSMRGEGNGPGGMMGGPGGMMGGRGGMRGGFGGRDGGPGGGMGGRDGGGMPGGGPGFMGGGRDRGGRDRGGMSGGRDRGGRGFAPPGEGGESNQDRFARFEGMLRGFDTNKDGVIDPNEVPEDRRRFLGFIGGRMGVDFSQPVAIDKLREKAAERFGGDTKKKEPEPLVPGFGESVSEATVLAFGQRESEATTSSGGTSSARGQNSNEQDARAQGFAEMMMRRYDRDGNGVLERDQGEWEGVRGDPNEIDRNHDGRIDRDEMVARVAAYMSGNRGRDRGRDRGDRGGDAGGYGGEPRGESQEMTKKSYRFLTATERLPEGLPGWFTERDRNKDGQISMAEYSSYWSDSEARKYQQYDLNDDGMITPEECLAAASRPGYAAPAPEPGGGPPAPGDQPPGDAKPAPEAKPDAKEEKKKSSGSKPWWMSS